MDYLTYHQRMEYLKELICNRGLNSPKEAAEIFDCSEKTVRNMINRLREMGLVINYCKRSQKYLLEE